MATSARPTRAPQSRMPVRGSVPAKPAGVPAAHPVASWRVVAIDPADREHRKYRALRVYAFDPSRGRRLGNYMTVRVKYEAMRGELKGKQLHVIDYDATNKRYYKPVNLNSEA